MRLAPCTAAVPRFFAYLLGALFLSIMGMQSDVFAAHSDTIDLEQSTATLLTAEDAVVGGQQLLVGLHVQLQEGWHTYTYNPGDSGIPMVIRWTLPEGAQVSDIHWPPHEVFNEGGLTTYGFKEEVVLTAIITLPPSVSRLASLLAKAEYLVCKDICIPQTAELVVDLPQGEDAPSREYDTLTAWFSKSRLQKDLPEIPGGGVPYAAGSDALAAAELPTQNPDIAPQPADSPTATALLPVGVVTAIFLALIGGVILNLMPCVFPVLSLKALTIARHTELSRTLIRKEAIAYTLGILCCFWVLAAITITLQQGGDALGWGFQFQSPAFVALMAMLMLFIGLNLSGIYELPNIFGRFASRLERADSLQGSFGTGLLVALVATPCTGPFMATAVGAALTLPPLAAMAIFTALGLGLALPFLWLGFFPHLIHRLPKPGAWMERFKQFLAFPMYLTALWLLWVIGTQTGISGMVLVIGITIAILFLLWAKKPCEVQSHFCHAAHTLLILALLAVTMQGLETLQQQAGRKPSAFASESVAYSPEMLAELRAAGAPVFVDATASWCITCQLNKLAALETDSVQAAFREHGVVLMTADWTNRDKDITDFLNGFGAKGVPLYVYYAPDSEGVVLPQILTPSTVIEAIQPQPQE